MSESIIQKNKLNHICMPDFTLPWVAPRDGFLDVRVAASSTGQLTQYIRDNSGDGYNGLGIVNIPNCRAGYQGTCIVPVIKGHEYTSEASANVQQLNANFFYFD